MIRVRKLLIISLCFVAGIAADAANLIKIHSVEGNVLLSRGGTSIKVRPGTVVKESDMVQIDRNGKVEFNFNGKNVFTSTSIGSLSVEKRIDDAKKSAKNIVRLTNSKIRESLMANAASSNSKNNSGVPGVAIHTTDKVVKTVAAPDGMSYLVYLRSLKSGEDYNNSKDLILMRRDYGIGNDSFNFAVFNTLDIPLYFNIIDQSNARMPELYFEDNHLAVPKDETIVDAYRYLIPDFEEGYIVIASNRDFTPDDVLKLLDPAFHPEADFYFSLLWLSNDSE